VLKLATPVNIQTSRPPGDKTMVLTRIIRAAFYTTRSACLRIRMPEL